MTDPGTLLLAQLMNEEWGRKLLALTGTNPVKTTEVTLNFDDQTAHGDHGVWTTFDAGWIVGISVFVPTQFNAGTTNALTFTFTTDLASTNPSASPFAQVAALSGASLIGEQVNGVPDSGSDVTFVPLRVAAQFRVLSGYSGSGTAATQGVAKIVFQHVGLLPS